MSKINVEYTNVIKKALGRYYHLGDIYDCTNETFFPDRSLLMQHLPVECKNKNEENVNLTFEYDCEDNYEVKFKKFDIDGDLSLSILSNMIEWQEGICYFNTFKESKKLTKFTVVCKVRTIRESFDLKNENVKKYFNFQVLNLPNTSTATHLVTGIKWGANVLVSFEHKTPSKVSLKDLEVNGKILIRNIMQTLRTGAEFKDEFKKLLKNYSIRIYGDVLPTNNRISQSFEETLEWMLDLLHHVQAVNNGKGKQIEYELTPLELLKEYFKINLNQISSVQFIDDQFAEIVISHLDGLLYLKRVLKDFFDDCKEKSSYLCQDVASLIVDKIEQLDLYVFNFKVELAYITLNVRSGIDSPEELSKHVENDFVKQIEKFIYKYSFLQEKFEMIDDLGEKGIYFLPKYAEIETLKLKNMNKNLFLLYTSDELIRNNKAIWEEKLKLFKDLKEKDNDAINSFFIIDYDLFTDVKNVQSIKICCFKQGEQINDNNLN